MWRATSHSILFYRLFSVVEPTTFKVLGVAIANTAFSRPLTVALTATFRAAAGGSPLGAMVAFTPWFATYFKLPVASIYVEVKARSKTIS